MNKKIAIGESSKIFDLTALKLLLSVVAISLASMMTSASTMPQDTFSLEKSVVSGLKTDLMSCSIPYATDYCENGKIKNSCELRGDRFLQSLAPFMNASMKPVCPLPRGSEGTLNES